MSLREDIEKVKKKIEETSFAYELLQDSRKTNKRLFIIIIVILSMWFISICAFVYYINTTGYEVVTETSETTDGGNACVGDSCNNGEINYGESNSN